MCSKNGLKIKEAASLGVMLLVTYNCNSRLPLPSASEQPAAADTQSSATHSSLLLVAGYFRAQPRLPRSPNERLPGQKRRLFTEQIVSMTLNTASDIVCDPPHPAPATMTEKIRWVVYFSWIGCKVTPGLIYNLILLPTEIYDLVR